MGIRRYALCFMILSCLLQLSASLSPSPAYVQGNRMGNRKLINEPISMRQGSKEVVEMNRRGSSNGGHSGRSSSSHAGGIGSGGRGGKTYGGGYGGSSHPYTPGSTTVIPVYGAGAIHRPRKSSGNTYHSRFGAAGLIKSCIVVFLVICL